MQRSSVGLCYWSVSLGEWKGNTLVLFLVRGPMLDRKAQQVDDGLRGGRRWRLPEVAECIAQIFCSSADFSGLCAGLLAQLVTRMVANNADVGVVR